MTSTFNSEHNYSPLEDFEALKKLEEEILSVQKEIRTYRVTPQVRLSLDQGMGIEEFDLERGADLSGLIKDVSKALKNHTIHVTHPRNFGNFNPSVTLPSIVGDTLAALYNPQLAVWAHAQASLEFESRVLNLFKERFGFNLESSIANFTTGGAEANLSAVVSALTHFFPEYGEEGLVGLSKQPVIYIARGGHESFVKAAHVTGLGRNSIRIVPTNKRHQIDVDSLQQKMNKDRTKSRFPLMVVGTAGTTTMGTIDPLGELGEFCKQEKIWFHVDAAWGGGAILSDRLKKELIGIELADSITCDAHKWLSVPMGAGMYFCKHKKAVLRAFRISTDYMPLKTDGRVDPYNSTIQWSRRNIGLKVFMSLAALGRQGMAKLIEHQAEMGEYLQAALKANGWKITNHSPFPLVCFTHSKIEGSEKETKRVADAVVASGEAWISNIKLTDGVPCLKACITSFKTQVGDVDHLVDLLNRNI